MKRRTAFHDNKMIMSVVKSIVGTTKPHVGERKAYVTVFFRFPWIQREQVVSVPSRDQR